jgi:predicted kinase
MFHFGQNLDEYYTQNPPKVDSSKARIRIPLVRLDNASAEYLAKEAKATHKKPEEIISEMVQERITASRGEPSPLSWLG